MKQFLTSVTIMGAVSLVYCGCATLINGTSEKVEIASLPPGATVWVDGTEEGVTPLTVSLKRKDDHSIRMTYDGHEPVEFQMKSRANWKGWVLGDLLIIWLDGIPPLVDVLTGAIYEFPFDQLFVELTK
ncbi:MAG: PEGA domain-containing protein [Bacteroidota bacterium]